MNINKENNLLNNNIVYDLTKFTHLDYPDKLACIVWFAGCNMRCDYCYNSNIVLAKNGNLSLTEILDFLNNRVGLLDGVVLSGGEATDYNLEQFCKEIKKLGFSIKLDTNGTNFKVLKNLCELQLIDYVALDYKAPEYKFKSVTKSNKYDEFLKSLQYLIKSSIDFEVRTTVNTDIINEDDINFMIKTLKNNDFTKNYYLQNFIETENNLGNIKVGKKILDISKISEDLKVIIRS